MRLWLIAVGRVRGGPAAALYDDYAARLAVLPFGPVTLREVEERRRLPADGLRAREAELLKGALPPGATVVALDERGAEAGSMAFAVRLSGWRDAGIRDLAFVIGGADGLDGAVRDRADWVLSLGRMTWPHRLVRVLVAEQLYRAQLILAGHPYHRD